METRNSSQYRVVGSAAFAVAATLFGQAALATDGDLDPTFGTGGIALMGETTVGLQLPVKPVVQADGKVLYCVPVNGTGPSGTDFLVARFNADGSPDTTFNFDGKVTIDFGGRNDECNAIAVQADGKIIAVGSSVDSTPQSDFAAARLNADGSLDPTFGAGTGQAIISFDLGGSNDDIAGAVTLQPDGKILLAGWVSVATNNFDFGVVRLLQDGSRDTTFNSTGRATVAFDFAGTDGTDQADAVMVDDAGRIILGGVAETTQSAFSFALARLLPNGTLDHNFNADGRATIDFNLGATNSALSYQSILTRDGKIVMVGAADAGSISTPNNDVAIARVLPDGSPDPSFGVGGKVVVAFDMVANGTDVGFGVVEDSAGRLVVGGTGISDAANDSRGLALRLMPSGALDASFGSFGKKTYDMGGSSEYLSGVALQQNQIIFGGFSTTSGTDVDAYVARAEVDLIFASVFE